MPPHTTTWIYITQTNPYSVIYVKYFLIHSGGLSKVQSWRTWFFVFNVFINNFLFVVVFRRRKLFSPSPPLGRLFLYVPLLYQLLKKIKFKFTVMKFVELKIISLWNEWYDPEGWRMITYLNFTPLKIWSKISRVFAILKSFFFF